MKWFWRVVFTLDILILLVLLVMMFWPGGDRIVIDAICSVLQMVGY